MAQWEKELAAKPDNLNSILRSRMVEENQFLYAVFYPTYTNHGAHACTDTNHGAHTCTDTSHGTQACADTSHGAHAYADTRHSAHAHADTGMAPIHRQTQATADTSHDRHKPWHPCLCRHIDK